jgi:hypothetical protein
MGCPPARRSRTSSGRITPPTAGIGSAAQDRGQRVVAPAGGHWGQVGARRARGSRRRSRRNIPSWCARSWPRRAAPRGIEPGVASAASARRSGPRPGHRPGRSTHMSRRCVRSASGKSALSDRIAPSTSASAPAIGGCCGIGAQGLDPRRDLRPAAQAGLHPRSVDDGVEPLRRHAIQQRARPSAAPPARCSGPAARGTGAGARHGGAARPCAPRSSTGSRWPPAGCPCHRSPPAGRAPAAPWKTARRPPRRPSPDRPCRTARNPVAGIPTRGPSPRVACGRPRPDRCSARAPPRVRHASRRPAR